MADITYFHTL